MKLLSFTLPSDPAVRLGVEAADGCIVDITRAAEREKAPGLPRTMLALIDGGQPSLDAVALLLGGDHADCHHASADIVYEPPVRPAKNVLCVGRNYRAHIIEGNIANGRPHNQFPTAIEFFTKPPTAVVGHGAPVLEHAAVTQKLDYEVELAIVIGKRGVDIREEDALNHVFGYTIINDVTARDLQSRHGQWFKGKGLDTTCPVGPVIVHRSAIADPNQLRIQMFVNGEQRQDSNTQDMIFSVRRIIAELSAGMTLEPGDLIATGTPQGVGFAMQPPHALKHGDKMEARVEQIGSLINTISA